MGGWANGIHIRINSEARTVSDLQAILTEPFYLAPVESGWVSVYPHRSISPPQAAQELSSHFQTIALTFHEYDGDAYFYEVFENGSLLDSYESDPDIFVDQPDQDGEPMPPKSEAERARVGGKPEVLIRLCCPNTSLAEVQETLDTQRHGGCWDVGRFASLLGISEFRLLAWFGQIETAIADGSEQFEVPFEVRRYDPAGRGADSG